MTAPAVILPRLRRLTIARLRARFDGAAHRWLLAVIDPSTVWLDERDGSALETDESRVVEDEDDRS